MDALAELSARVDSHEPRIQLIQWNTSSGTIPSAGTDEKFLSSLIIMTADEMKAYASREDIPLSLMNDHFLHWWKHTTLEQRAAWCQDRAQARLNSSTLRGTFTPSEQNFLDMMCGQQLTPQLKRRVRKRHRKKKIQYWDMPCTRHAVIKPRQVDVLIQDGYVWDIEFHH